MNEVLLDLVIFIYKISESLKLYDGPKDDCFKRDM